MTSAFESAEAIRYVELARMLLMNADGNFTAKNFDPALSNLLETDHNVSMAEDAEKAAVKTRTETQVPTGRLPEIPFQVIAVAIIVVVVGWCGQSNLNPYMRGFFRRRRVGWCGHSNLNRHFSSLSGPLVRATELELHLRQDCLTDSSGPV